MNNVLKTLACGTLLLGASAANAAQTDITVTADVDPTVALTQADGTALPDSVKMQYTPAKGLAAYKANVKVWSNSSTAAINVQLAGTPQLTDINGLNPIPLSVAINGQTLTTTSTSLAYATIFPSGSNTNGSLVMPFVISQTTPSATVTAGHYSGVVSVIVTQATTK